MLELDVNTIPADELPTLLARLAAWQAAVLARMMQATPVDPPDALLTLEEAAARLGVDPNWIRRRPALPFRVSLSAGVVRYSANGISDFIAAHRTG